MMKTQYKIDHHATLEQLEALEKEWSDLLDEIPDAPIYFTWEWVRTWWLHFGKGRQLWLLTARDEQGRLVAIAPLMREEYKKAWMRLGMITFLGTGRVCPTNLKILTRGSDKERLYRAFLGFLFGQSDQWDILRIPSVAEDSKANELLYAAGGRIRIGAQITYISIHLPDNWEAYLKTISNKLRYNIKSAKSRLESDYPGLVKFAYITNPRDVDSAMEKLVELIRHKCHTKTLSTDWDDPTFTSFHRTIASLALDRGWLRLWTLTVKDQIIALLYDFRFKDSIFGYNAGFDIDWSEYSPGRLLLAHSIQTAIREAASEYEFGRVGAEYKFAWTNRVREENEILFSSNWRGELWIRFGNLERGLKIRAKQLLTRIAQIRTKQFVSPQDRNKEKGGKEILTSRS